MLKGNVEIGQHLAFGHQRNDFVDVRVGIDIVQAHPDAELAQRLRQIGTGWTSRPPQKLGLVLQVHAIGARVLRDDQEFLHAGLHQPFGFAHHVGDGPAHQVAAHRGMMQNVQR